MAVRKRKLGLLLLIASIVTIASALVLYALRQNISLFYTPTQISRSEAPLNHTIRIGGMVEKGSLIRTPGSMEVRFIITDFAHSTIVYYKGILPDLFREGQGIVTEGILLDNQRFKASEVLAKHDANYMPPEVRATLVNQKAVS